MDLKLEELAQYSACDITDALLKLKVPGAGFLPDLIPYSPHGPHHEKLPSQRKLVAQISTVLMVPIDVKPGDAELQGIEESNIPAGTHYVDITRRGTIVVTSQPKGCRAAALGGIMALRMKTRGVHGAVVGGRIRDLRELRALKFPAWALATSTMGSGQETQPWALEVPITVQGIQINPSDIMFCDPVEGIVVIPQDKLDAVLDLVPKLVEADDKVMDDVLAGMAVKDAFARHRGTQFAL